MTPTPFSWGEYEVLPFRRPAALVKKLDRKHARVYSTPIGPTTPFLYLPAMSTELPGKVQSVKLSQKVVIVAATYNEMYTSALLENCLAELQECAPFLNVEVVRVPGSLEVPVMVKRAICKPVHREPALVIALGVILRGSTAHADLIGTAITNQLLGIACETMVPVVDEVLLLDNEQQAFARCIAASLNRGREAARTALNMLNVLREQEALANRSLRRASTMSAV